MISTGPLVLDAVVLQLPLDPPAALLLVSQAMGHGAPVLSKKLIAVG